MIATDELGRVFRTWTLGDAAGVLVVAPALLTWAAGASRGLRRRDLVEAAVLLVLLVVLAELPPQRDVPYVVFPALLWAALRFGPRGAATAVLIVCSITVWNTAQDAGPFVRDSLTDSLLATQLFIATAAVTSLLLAAVTAERTRAARALATAEAAQHELADEQAALRRVATLVAGDAPPSRVFEQVTEEVGRLLGLPGANVMQYDGVRTATVVGAWSEHGQPRFPVGATLDIDGDTVVAKVVRSGEAARVDRYDEASGRAGRDARERRLPRRRRRAGHTSAGGCGACWPPRAPRTSRCPRTSSSGCATSPSSSPRRSPTPTRTRSWPPRARGSWRSATPSGSGSSATSTTAPSSGSSRSPSGSAWWRRGSRATRRPPASCSRRPRPISPAGSTSCASWPAASTRRCSPSAGSAPALDALLARAPLPSRSRACRSERLAAPVEAAVYYVVAESITNVAKYAHASSATVTIAPRERRRHGHVSDDGVGGADPGRRLGAARARGARRGAQRPARRRQPARRRHAHQGGDPAGLGHRALGGGPALPHSRGMKAAIAPAVVAEYGLDARFEQLQAQMVPVHAAMRAQRGRRCMVVVPSRSIERWHEPPAETQAYEERLLCLLPMLRDPGLSIVYVTSSPIAPAIVEYYLSLIPPRGAP